ncbi:MAG: SH3 domain-containing protein [bacterium]
MKEAVKKSMPQWSYSSLWRNLAGPILPWLALAIVSLFLVSACVPKETPKTGAILGVIFDRESNEVLSDVKVSSGAILFTTSSVRGVFQLSTLPYGQTTISFQKALYKSTTRTITLMEEKIFLEILLERDQIFATTAVEEVKMRAAPMQAGEILEVLPKGVQVILTKEESMGWYRLQFNGKNGWAWGGYLRSSDLSIPSLIVIEDCKLLQQPGGGEEAGEAYAGLGVIRLESKDEWIRVILPSGVEGWMEVKRTTS